MKTIEDHDTPQTSPPNRTATVEDAIAIAAQVHQGQTDKAGAPYILHPLRLMMRMTSADAMITAILHDVVEDSSPQDKWTFDRLRDYGFSEKVVEAVDGVTIVLKTAKATTNLSSGLQPIRLHARSKSQISKTT